MDIVLIRHGESEANINKTYGDRYVRLSERGIEQARISSQYTNNLYDKKVYVSPYVRAVETMEYLGLSGEVDEDLREVDFGIAHGKTYEELSQKYPRIVQAWNQDPLNYGLPAGESLRDAYERVAGFLDRVIDENRDVVLICHDGVIRLALSYVFNRMDYFFRFMTENLSFTNIRVVDGYKYIVYQNRVYY